MIPKKLRISGFLSYREPVEVDFTNLNLACISGANGAGKSSLLDAITFALFGQARKNNDALIHSKAKQAEVVYDFSYEQNLYRIQRIRIAGKTGQLEFFIHAGEHGWRPLTEATMRQTEERIRSTLSMDYDTFINASFFLQGKADQFAQQKPGDRKRILSTILGLENWELYKEAAAERRRQVEQENRSLQDRLIEIENELAEEPTRQARLKSLQEQLAHASANRQGREKNLAAARKLSAALEEQRRHLLQREKQHADLITRQEGLKSRLEQIRSQRDEQVHLLTEETQIRAEYADWQANQARLEQMNLLAGQSHQLETRRGQHLHLIQTARLLLENEQTALIKEQERLALQAHRSRENEQKLEDLQRQEADLTARLARRTDMQEQLNHHIKELSDLNAEKSQLKIRREEIQKRLASLAEASGSLCPLCGQPLTPAERDRLLAELTGEEKTCSSRFQALQNELGPQAEKQRAEQVSQLQQLERVEMDLRALQRQIAALQENLNSAQAQQNEWEESGAPRLAELTDRLEHRAYAEEDQAEMSRLDEQLAALGYDAAAHQTLRQAEQAGRTSEARLRQLENARAALQPLESELTDLTLRQTALEEDIQTSQAELDHSRSQLQNLSGDLQDENEAERLWQDAQEAENRLRTELGKALQDVEVLEVQKKRQQQVVAERQTLLAQISRLKALERAFSKDGVPALLIEQALPEIEAHANEILDRISGGGMSVRFDTLRDFRDAKREDKKETLDIIISDAAGPREYELFSGGEAFRVNFAIRLALSRVLAQRAGARLQTLVIDEGFGSQDAEGLQRLIEAINQVSSEFACILVITHLEDMKDAFPARIQVEKTLQGSAVTVFSA